MAVKINILISGSLEMSRKYVHVYVVKACVFVHVDVENMKTFSAT